jgi:hypothetical protein
MNPILIIVFIIAGFFIMQKSGIVTASYLEIMAQAIKKQEGYYPGSRSYRNNNPGNLRWKSTNGKYPWKGATGADSTFHVIFDTYENGYNALLYQLRLAFENKSSVYHTGMNLYDFFMKYAEGNQTAYAQNVAKALGVSPATTLQQIKDSMV